MGGQDPEPIRWSEGNPSGQAGDGDDIENPYYVHHQRLGDKFPWGGKMRVARKRNHDQGLTETKLRALAYVTSSYELALRTSKRLRTQLENKRPRRLES